MVAWHTGMCFPHRKSQARILEQLVKVPNSLTISWHWSISSWREQKDVSCFSDNNYSREKHTRSLMYCQPQRACYKFTSKLFWWELGFWLNLMILIKYLFIREKSHIELKKKILKLPHFFSWKNGFLCPFPLNIHKGEFPTGKPIMFCPLLTYITRAAEGHLQSQTDHMAVVTLSMKMLPLCSLSIQDPILMNSLLKYKNRST